MSLAENIPIARKTMVLFFVVDTSGSMIGSKIGTLNSAVEETIPELKDLSSSNADAQIKVAVLSFSSGTEWLTPSGPIEVENFVWNDLNAGGVTDFGEACRELNKKLKKEEFMESATGSYAPAIVLLSDGGPTDEYVTGLNELKQNNWFKKAIKAAIAIGSDADKSVLQEFTGASEAVLEAKNKKELRKIIHFVSVRSSEVASRSAQTGDGAKSKQDIFVDDLSNLFNNITDDSNDEDDEGIIW